MQSSDQVWQHQLKVYNNVLDSQSKSLLQTIKTSSSNALRQPKGIKTKKRCSEIRAIVISNHTNTVRWDGFVSQDHSVLAFLPKSARRFTLACDIHILVIHKHTAPSASLTWVAH